MMQVEVFDASDPADVDETPLAGEPPVAYVARVARTKALAIARRSN